MLILKVQDTHFVSLRPLKWRLTVRQTDRQTDLQWKEIHRSVTSTNTFMHVANRQSS